MEMKAAKFVLWKILLNFLVSSMNMLQGKNMMK